MDESNRRTTRSRPPSSSSAFSTGTSENAPRAGAAAGSRRQSLQPPLQAPGASSSRHLSPSPSRQYLNPATPDAAEDSGTEYFPPLRDTITARSQNSSLFPTSRPVSHADSDANRPGLERSRQPSIRIRRSSNASLRSRNASTAGQQLSEASGSGARQRSISQPITAPAPVFSDANIARHSRKVPQIALPRLTEEGGRPSMSELGLADSNMSPTRSLPDESYNEPPPTPGNVGVPGRKLSRKRRISRLFWPGANNQDPSLPPNVETAPVRQGPTRSDEFDEQLVDWLDIIDPEVQTLSTLTNVQNSLFVPDLGGWINRRPTYVLSQHDADAFPPFPRHPDRYEERPQDTGVLSTTTTATRPEGTETGEPVGLRRSDTITSRLTESHYAALPHGFTLEGWTEEEKLELDDHVRHMLHSRRSRFKRTMKGFGQYVRRPLGFFVTLYATLITLFGLAWVLFLIGWIYVGTQQVYAIHIIDSVLVALFAVMGDGLAPFRAVDTYHLIFIVHYSRKIEKARKKKMQESRTRRSSQASQRDGGNLFGCGNGNNVELADTGLTSTDAFADRGLAGLERPSPMQSVEQVPSAVGSISNDRQIAEQNIDLENIKLEVEYETDSPLTYKQWKTLRHHQKKLAKSHSFYKPDETFTHYPFRLGYLMAIIILLDCHSCLQISLGATTWGIDYHHRPFAITTVILCVSITCNLTAGLVIMIGDRKTRKKDVVALLDRQELTGDAIKHLEDKRAKDPSRSDIGVDQNQRQEQQGQQLQQDGGLIKEEVP